MSTGALRAIARARRTSGRCVPRVVQRRAKESKASRLPPAPLTSPRTLLPPPASRAPARALVRKTVAGAPGRAAAVFSLSLLRLGASGGEIGASSRTVRRRRRRRRRRRTIRREGIAPPSLIVSRSFRAPSALVLRPFRAPLTAPCLIRRRRRRVPPRERRALRSRSHRAAPALPPRAAHAHTHTARRQVPLVSHWNGMEWNGTGRNGTERNGMAYDVM